MLFENTNVFNFEGALGGMRNPMNSWDKSDSGKCYAVNCNNCPLAFNKCSKIKNSDFVLGEEDLKLAQSLIKAGSEHRKFLRQIFVSVDITAPLFWWNEFDTYKVGTVANSTSKMHKLASTPITIDCFEMDDFADNLSIEYSEDGAYFLNKDAWKQMIKICENLRITYNKTKDKYYWKELIRLLPESWLQKRTVTMNYENVLNMYHQRKNHKLNEWSGKNDPAKPNFCSWVMSLCCAEQFFIEPFEKKRK